MAVKPEHASSDLALGMRYNSVVDCSDDIDPELLHLGVEEEEEEEEDEEEEDEEDLDEEDRGDDIDPDLPADEGDDADPDADPDKDDEGGADDEGDDPDLDPDALAELAGEGSKAKMVPHARFNEVNETLKQERAERLRLEEELARAKGQAPKPAEEEPQKAYDFDAAEDRYMDAVLDGDKDKARQIRAEIRAEEHKRFEAQGSEGARKAAEEEIRRRDAEAEQEKLGKVLTGAMEKYPFLNHESDEANKEAIEDVIVRRDFYMKQGHSISKAVAMAVEKVAPRYAPAQEEPRKTGKPEASKDQILRNLERERQIPAAMPGVGERGKDIDYASLSEDEFDALPEADKRKARGDFVKQDA